jgi:16S rRNA (guanine527-N7)-methyltransferase
VDVSRETLIPIFGELTDQANEYGQILATTAVERGLIGPREVDRIWDRHIFNSLPLITLMPEGVTVIDIGSGAGLPGIVLGLARPDLQITLLEPLERRANFLAEVIAQLELANLQVVRGRAEQHKPRFQIVTARAVAPLPKLLQISWRLIAPGGKLLALKGENAQNELDEAPISRFNPSKAEVILASFPLLPEQPPVRVISIEKAG